MSLYQFSLNHVNFILQIKKQQKIQLAQSIHYCIFPTICTIKKTKKQNGFTCHKNPKPVFVWGECVHLCFMWLYLLVSLILMLSSRGKHCCTLNSLWFKIKQQNNKWGLIYKKRVEISHETKKRVRSPQCSFSDLWITSITLASLSCPFNSHNETWRINDMARCEG